MTEWRPIPGFSNYECTQAGEIRSVARYVTRGRGEAWRDAVMMTPSPLAKYPRQTRLCVDHDTTGKTTTTPQRLIYETWIGEVPLGYRVEVIDKDKPADVKNIKLMAGKKVERTAIRKVRMSTMEGFCHTMACWLSRSWA